MEQFLQDDAPSNGPFLLLHKSTDNDKEEDAQLFIILEKDVLCECLPVPQVNAGIFITSLVTLLAVFFSFNLEYADTQKNLFKFLAQHVLDIVPKRKTYVLRKIENRLLGKLNSA